MAVVVDTSEFDAGIKKLVAQMGKKVKKGLQDVANEILRLSTFEVPHDIGMLQASGTQEPEGDAVIVGYNKVYAARLHENPQFNFQKGRKGKYLEDPIKNNLSVLLNHLAKPIKQIF